MVRSIYLEFCAECHQTDGTGVDKLYPKLAGNPIVTLHDPSPLIDTVKYGQGSMMAFRDQAEQRRYCRRADVYSPFLGKSVPTGGLDDCQVH